MTTKKVLIIGDAGVGKSSLRAQFFNKPFSTSYNATIGANFLTKNVEIQVPSSGEPSTNQSQQRTVTKTVSLCIWDTAGQERFNSLSPTFFRGGECAILLYDVTSPQSLSNITTHYRDFTQYCGTKSPVIVVAGNKADAESRRVTTVMDAQIVVRREMDGDDGPIDRVIDCFEVSARLGTSVEELFMDVAKKLCDRDERREVHEFDYGDEGGVVDLKRSRQASSSCAC